MRPAEHCVLEMLGIPAGALGTGAGGEMWHSGPQSGLRCSHDLSFQIASLPLGGGVPPRSLRESRRIVKALRSHHARLKRNRYSGAAPTGGPPGGRCRNVIDAKAPI